MVNAHCIWFNINKARKIIHHNAVHKITYVVLERYKTYLILII
jgi:hypothetical protein